MIAMCARRVSGDDSDVPSRLDDEDVGMLLDEWPDDLAELALELQTFVREIAPGLNETISFNSICYYKPDSPYRTIGGNVCMIGHKDGCLHLGFIHGAALPDPDGLLTGTGKAKRYIEIRSRRDIRRRAFRKLIRAAIANTPGE
jgi:hypothetical protein